MRKLAVLCFCVALSAACSSGERYGAMNGTVPVVPVKELMLDASLGGREVRVKGAITIQCASTGCWFFLDDGTAQVLVDLQGLGLGLPPRSGKTAEVSGTLTVDAEGQVRIAAKGLVISS